VITTFTGRLVDPLDLQPEDLHIDDIARSLSHQCRFNGHTRSFFSVGEHSLWVRRIVNDWGHGPRLQLTALLHDAAEAYVMDLPGPLADKFPEYRAAEARAHEVVSEAFGLPHPWPRLIHDADRQSCNAEARNLLPICAWRHFDELPAHAPRDHHRPGESPMSPWTAEQEFKRMFFKLREEVS